MNARETIVRLRRLAGDLERLIERDGENRLAFHVLEEVSGIFRDLEADYVVPATTLEEIEKRDRQVFLEAILTEGRRPTQDEIDRHCLLEFVRGLEEQLRLIRSGKTVRVEFNLEPAEKEGAIRDALIRLGWIPPGALSGIKRYSVSGSGMVENLAGAWVRFSELFDKAGNPEARIRGEGDAPGGGP